MEHVINAKLRNQAFWKFMIFFIVTIVIIVAAVYFDYDVPNKNNSMLRTQVAHYQKDSNAQQAFIAELQEIKNLIDSLGKQGADNRFLMSSINDKLVKLNGSQNLNSDDNIKFNRLILDVFLSYKNVKDQNIGLADADKTIKQLNEKLNECINRRDDYFKQLNAGRGLQ